MSGTNLAASVRARLRNLATAEGIDFGAVLTRYGLERMLYRLSISEDRNSFLLKGALLFDVWFDTPTRPTRDIDLSASAPPMTNGSRACSARPAQQSSTTAWHSIRIAS